MGRTRTDHQQPSRRLQQEWLQEGELEESGNRDEEQDVWPHYGRAPHRGQADYLAEQHAAHRGEEESRTQTARFDRER